MVLDVTDMIGFEASKNERFSVSKPTTLQFFFEQNKNNNIYLVSVK